MRSPTSDSSSAEVLAEAGADMLSKSDRIGLLHKELARYGDRSFGFGQSTISIISAEVVVLTAGVVAYDQYPVAFCLVPLTWAVWLFQSLVNDYDTLKVATYVKWLEQSLNREAGTPLAGFETKLTDRPDPFALVYVATYASYGVMNAGAWAFSCWIVSTRLGAWPTAAFIAVWVAHYCTVFWYVVRRPSYIETLEGQLGIEKAVPSLKQAEDADNSPGAVAGGAGG